MPCFGIIKCSNTRIKVYSNLQDVINSMVFLQWVFFYNICAICITSETCLNQVMSDTCCVSCPNLVLNSDMHPSTWCLTDTSYTRQRIDIFTNSNCLIEIRLFVAYVSMFLSFIMSEGRCQSTLVLLSRVTVRHMYRYGKMYHRAGCKDIKMIALLIPLSHLLSPSYSHSCIQQFANAKDQRLRTETRPFWSRYRTNPTRKTNRTCSS